MSYARISQINFYDEGKFNASKSKPGVPVFDKAIYLEFIRSDGTAFRRPSYPIDRKKFPKSWKAYQNGEKAAEEGTRLEELFGIIPAECKTLRHEEIGIKTVEELASAPKEKVAGLGDRFVELHIMAETFLRKKGEAEIEIAKRRKEFQAEVEMQKKVELETLALAAEKKGGADKLSEADVDKALAGEELDADDDLELEVDDTPPEIRSGVEALSISRSAPEVVDPLEHDTTEDPFGD